MTRQLSDQLSFRQIASIPLDACLAALDNWQLNGPDGELHLGHSLLIGRPSAITAPAPAGSRSAWPGGRCARRYACGWTSTTGRTPAPPSSWSRASG